MRLKDRRAVITGAASGIGRATALRFAAEGADVLIVDRDSEGAEETVRLGADAPGRFETLLADVTDQAAPDAMMAACREAFGPIDILINNAGIGAAKAIDATEDEDLDRFLDVNLRAAFRVARAAVREMRGRGGAIVHLASVFGLMGFPGSSIYSATKAALIGLTQNMAADYGRDGIRVNALAPGSIVTPLSEERLKTNPWFLDALVGSTPMARLGKPEEIAAAALFLSSDDASYVTGQVLAVDGGWSTTKYRPPPDPG
ncbi:MAG: SDR family oxidoreductase [Alphaproteobacteria bacterium]|nr:SDR family oxidoreductase [Alphaproteobacteria bacterium]